MKFLGDMGISPAVVDWCRTQGHDATHLRDEGLQQLADRAIMDKARAEHRIVLTVDLDFGEIVALSENPPPSVVLFRLRNMRTSHVIERLRRVLEATGDLPTEGTIVVIEESRHRVRHLPIGE